MRAGSVVIDSSGWEKSMDLKLADLNREMPRTMARIGLTMQDLAQDMVPKVTGHLARSITHEEGTDGGGTYWTDVGTNMHYAPYVEFGTGDAGSMSRGEIHRGIVTPVTYTAGWPGVRARPYLRPALYDYAETYKRMVREAVQRAIR